MKPIEKIKAEVDRLKHSGYAYNRGAYEAICTIEDFINSLQAEPVSEDLELASERYACKFSSSKYGHDKVKDAVIWGANWQKEQMLKDAVDANVSFGQPVLLAKPIPTNIAKDGDKVKLIIVKEE